MTDPDETVYLTLDDLLSFVDLLGAGPVRDVGLLDSACARARSSAFGHDAYPSVELKAAALLHSICGNHALVDGNKRLGLVATVTFLRANGHRYELGDQEWFELVMSVAAGEIDVPEIAARLRVSDE